MAHRGQNLIGYKYTHSHGERIEQSGPSSATGDNYSVTFVRISRITSFLILAVHAEGLILKFTSSKHIVPSRLFHFLRSSL